MYLANVQQTLPYVLQTLEQFGQLPGCKVNLPKLALMLINTDKNKKRSLFLPRLVLQMRSLTWELRLVLPYHLWLKQITF